MRYHKRSDGNNSMSTYSVDTGDLEKGANERSKQFLGQGMLKNETLKIVAEKLSVQKNGQMTKLVSYDKLEEITTKAVHRFVYDAFGKEAYQLANQRPQLK